MQNFPQFLRLLAAFAGVAVPAAAVNSGLKYMQKRIQIAFMRRLSHHLHQRYCSNRAYYAASTLGGLTNADQRITEDVEKFAYNISELYSYTFKVVAECVDEMWPSLLLHVLSACCLLSLLDVKSVSILTCASLWHGNMRLACTERLCCLQLLALPMQCKHIGNALSNLTFLLLLPAVQSSVPNNFP